MNIHCLGVSHNTASVALRERISFSHDELNTALTRLSCGGDGAWSVIQECAILSTCNRVEVYAVAREPVFEVLADFLAVARGVPAGEIFAASYRLLDESAAGHLLRVAAGLDSLVLGEPQILGQVTEAYSVARRHGTTGKILSRLFQTAIHAGKRTRTETAISQNPASISSVAVNLIASNIPSLAAAHVLVIGAGEMAELAIEALRKRGAFRFTVANRTIVRAQTLADRCRGTAAPLEYLQDLLAEVDVVITSTGAPHTIISVPMLASAMAIRQNRPLVIMDIAIPRDVEAGAENLPNVRRFDLDDLGAQLESTLALREAEVPAVEAILAEEEEGFRNYLASLDVVPVISEMRAQANAIRESELEKAFRRLPDLDPAGQQQLDLLTQSIVKKILHNPTIRLREAAGDSSGTDYADVTRKLFGLDGNGSHE
ncbi:MAG: glutamyl-tRNA reductase [Anaerolineales bacterium]|nr:glutamyl-tRNA reductase [Anaerolineales bacterium]